MVDIGAITPGPAERSATIGGTRAGKSALEEWRMRHVQQTRPMCMPIIVDSKPRFRAETERGPFRNGRKDAKRRYENWTAGPVVPNSVLIDIWDEKPFKDVWNRPGEIAVMQGGELADWKRMLYLLNGFVGANIKGRERLIYVDEVLDFYGRNTLGIDSKNDVFLRAARAGGERNIGLWISAHRVRGLPPLMIAMLSRITLFHLRTDADMKYLQESGIPDAKSPEGNYTFRQWTIEPGGTVSKPFTGRVSYPDSYLNQLSNT
jgi:hypothetical protein